MVTLNKVRRSRICVAVFACVGIVALILDRVTKVWALQELSMGENISVIPGLLTLQLLHNPGASLGMGSSTTWLISLLAIVMSICLLIAGCMSRSLVWSVCLGLALAGAFGNLIDRVIYANGVLNGSVVDFLNYGWSVGNVADIWLVIAGVGLVILIFASVPFRPQEQEGSPERSSAAMETR